MSMSDLVEKYELPSGKTLKIFYDTDAETPRDWENVGTLATWHDRSTIGEVQLDRHSSTHMVELIANAILAKMWEDAKREETRAEKGEKNRRAQCFKAARSFQASLERIVSADYAFDEYTIKINALIEKYAFILPVYCYEHSGMTIKTGPFGDPWDSGQVGVVFCTKERARHEWGGETGILNQKRVKQVYACLESEVSVMDDYIRGAVYGYVLADEDENEIESCWMYYGDNILTNGIIDQVSLDKKDYRAVLRALPVYKIDEARKAGIKIPKNLWDKR